MEVTMDLMHDGVVVGEDGKASHDLKCGGEEVFVSVPVDVLPASLKEAADRFRNDSMGKEGLPIRVTFSWVDY